VDTNTQSMRMGTSGTTRILGLSLTAKKVSTLVVDEDVVVAGIRVVSELFAAAMKAVAEQEFLTRCTTQLARLHPGLLVRATTAGNLVIIKGLHCVLDSHLDLRQQAEEGHLSGELLSAPQHLFACLKGRKILDVPSRDIGK
jgi:hypothetical protein